MTNGEIVEWVAQARIGDVLPVPLVEIVHALHEEIGMRMPDTGEALTYRWIPEAQVAARAAVENPQWEER